MNKQVTFRDILAILSTIIIPLFIWGVSIETRFAKGLEHIELNSYEIKAIKEEAKTISEIMNSNQIEIIDKLHNIELQLKDKEDRE